MHNIPKLNRLTLGATSNAATLAARQLAVEMKEKEKKQP